MAFSGGRTRKTRARNPPRRTVRKLISIHRRSIFSRPNARRIPSQCSDMPSRSSNGKKYHPWWATTQRISRLRWRVARFGREGEGAQGDVWVGAILVRVGVVPVVLALPPAVADPHQQVRDEKTDPVVPPPGLEDLAMRCVVAEERELGHHDREYRAGQELPPAVADPDEGRHPGQDGRDGTDQFGPVVAVPATHQAQVVDGLGQCCERAAGLAGRSGRGVSEQRGHSGPPIDSDHLGWVWAAANVLLVSRGH